MQQNGQFWKDGDSSGKIEPLTFNQGVMGSNPIGLTKQIKHFRLAGAFPCETKGRPGKSDSKLGSTGYALRISRVGALNQV
jgi:hypothetical protein